MAPALLIASKCPSRPNRRSGIYPFSRSPDHKVPYAKWVISYEHRGDGQSLGRLGNLAAHPGVNASDYSALVSGALYNEMGIS